jgi:hypothetical protein
MNEAAHALPMDALPVLVQQVPQVQLLVATVVQAPLALVAKSAVPRAQLVVLAAVPQLAAYHAT